MASLKSAEILKAVVKSCFEVRLDVDSPVPAAHQDGVGYFLSQDWLTFGHALVWASKVSVSKLVLMATEVSTAREYQRLVDQRIDSGLEIEVHFLSDGTLSSVAADDLRALPDVSGIIQSKSEALKTLDGLEFICQTSAKNGAYMSVMTAGLEIARIIEFESEAVVEVGVGQADREIHALTSEGTAEEILVKVSDKVKSVRHTARDKFHPLAKLDPAGFLRFCAATELEYLDAEPLISLPNLRSDDVFNETARAAYSNDALYLFVVGADTSVYELAGDYLQLLKEKSGGRIVLVSSVNDAPYLKPECLAGLGVNVEIRSLEDFSKI